MNCLSNGRSAGALISVYSDELVHSRTLVGENGGHETIINFKALFGDAVISGQVNILVTVRQLREQ